MSFRAQRGFSISPSDERTIAGAICKSKIKAEQGHNDDFFK